MNARERRPHERGRATGRRPAHRSPGKRFLIICEGQTEQAYFRYVSAQLRGSGVVIAARVGNKGSDPVKIVEEAVRRSTPNPGRGVTAEYDEIWAVLDHDGREARVREALAVADTTSPRVNVALSDPCFDLWLLWHFTDLGGPRDQNEIRVALESAWPGFTKGSATSYAPLRGRFELAARRSERVRTHLGGDPCSRPGNPGSNVDQLVMAVIDAHERSRGRRGHPL